MCWSVPPVNHWEIWCRLWLWRATLQVLKVEMVGKRTLGVDWCSSNHGKVMMIYAKKWCYIRIKGRKSEMDGNWWLFSCKHVENAWKPPHCGWDGPNIDFEICHCRICQNIPECIEQLQHILMKDILAAHVAGATMLCKQFTRTDEHWPRREETWAQGFAGGLCCLILKDQRSRNKSKSMLWSKGLAPSE